MLTCKEVTEMASAHLDRELSRFDRLRVQVHLAMCRHCRTYVNQLWQLVQALRKMPRDPAPPAVHAALREQFRAWKDKN